MDDKQRYRRQMLLKYDSNYRWNLFMNCKNVLARHDYNISAILKAKERKIYSKYKVDKHPYKLKYSSVYSYNYIEAMRCLRHLSEAEQNKRIHQVYQYIMQHYTDSDKIDKDKIIYETDKITLLSDFIRINDIYGSYGEYILEKTSLYLVYCLNLLGYTSYYGLDTDIKYFNDFFNNKQIMDENSGFLMSMTIDYMYNLVVTYIQKILFIIDDAICDIKQGTIK